MLIAAAWITRPQTRKWQEDRYCYRLQLAGMFRADTRLPVRNIPLGRLIPPVLPVQPID